MTCAGHARFSSGRSRRHLRGYAGAVSINNDGAFDIGEFHDTLIRVERETWYTVSSSLMDVVGTLVISIKSDKDRNAKSAPHAFIGVLAS